MAFRELEMALSQAVMALPSCRLPPPCAFSPYLIKTSLLSESHRWFGDNTKIKLDSKCFLWHPVFKTGCPCAVQSEVISLQRRNINHTSKYCVFMRTCLYLWTLNQSAMYIIGRYLYMAEISEACLTWFVWEMSAFWTQSQGSFPLTPAGIVSNLSVLYSRQTKNPKYFYNLPQNSECWGNLEIFTRSPQMHLHGCCVQISDVRQETRNIRKRKY